jgi:hypothetical protein
MITTMAGIAAIRITRGNMFVTRPYRGASGSANASGGMAANIAAMVKNASAATTDRANGSKCRFAAAGKV